MRYITYDSHKISKLSLGTVQFGLDYGVANSIGKPSQEKVDEIIDFVYSNGINCFDTAQAYGDSEKVLSNPLRNKDVFIISKINSNLFNKQLLSKSVDKSLNNLKKDKLFALLLHDSKALYKWDKNSDILVNSLKYDKKIDYFGVSIYTNEEFELAIKNYNISFIQIPFNLFDQRALKFDWFDKAKEKNKLIFIRSIFLQGLFFLKPYQLPNNLQSAKQYLEKKDIIKNNLSLNDEELAISYVDSVANDSVILFGCDTIKQAKQNLNVYDCVKKLDKTIIDEIKTEFINIPENIYNPTKWSLK